MKVLLIFLNLLVFDLIYAQNCVGFKEGTFISENTFGTMFIERKGNFQLERTKDNSTIYLQKIEKISDCDYVLKRYKIILIGNLPEPNMNEGILVKITSSDGNNFQYNANLIGTELSIKGTFIKTSDEISEEFKRIIYQDN